MHQEKIIEERRRTPRQRVFKGAHILGGGQSVTCIVRNVSPHGAGLEIADSTQPLPRALTLVIDAEKTVRRGHLRWRNAARIGVEFD